MWRVRELGVFIGRVGWAFGRLVLGRVNGGKVWRLGIGVYEIYIVIVLVGEVGWIRC